MFGLWSCWHVDFSLVPLVAALDVYAGAPTKRAKQDT
jgi:hypothetical protein